MWCPAVAVTKSPPCSANRAAIASAFSRRNARRRVGLLDDGAERDVVDALVARIGRQRHRRLEQGLARHDVVTAGKVLAVAAKIDAREDDLRAGRADVDTDRHQ